MTDRQAKRHWLRRHRRRNIKFWVNECIGVAVALGLAAAFAKAFAIICASR